MLEKSSILFFKYECLIIVVEFFKINAKYDIIDYIIEVLSWLKKRNTLSKY